MSIRTTSASCFPATPRATVAPTFPAPPTTVTFRFISAPHPTRNAKPAKSAKRSFLLSSSWCRRTQLPLKPPREKIVGFCGLCGLCVPRPLHVFDHRVRELGRLQLAGAVHDARKVVGH